MNNSIDIINSENGKINPIFIRVCNQLIDKNEKLFNFYRPAEDKNQTLKELWFLEYGAELVKNEETEHWQKIVFKNSKDMMLFLMKQN